jgi:hypothetical protein
MKKLLTLAAILVFVFAGCDDNDSTLEGVSFQSYSPASVSINNNTGERLIAFKNSLSPYTLISGIPANAVNHGLKRDTGLFDTTKQFVLVLITEAQYNANKNNLRAAQVFTRILAFYSTTGIGTNYTISSSLGGTGQLIVKNLTEFNVELRKDSPFGELIGFAAANSTMGNVINLLPGDYNIFPVISYFNVFTQELTTVIPLFTDGPMLGQPLMWTFGFTFDNDVHTLTLNLPDMDLSGILTADSARFRIINNSVTAVQLWQDNVLQLTATGFSTINPGTSVTFVLAFPRNPDGAYPESLSFTNLRIGTSAFSLPVPEQAYKLGYLYEIVVTGSNIDSLELGVIIEKEKI